MINGECLCKKIKFQAEEVPGMVFNCHCLNCKKAHGAAFATQVIAHKTSLIFNSGKQLVKDYHSGGALRAFCINCGARIMNYGPDSVDYLSISLTVIKNYERFKLTGDCYIKSKLSFINLMPSSKKFIGLPPGF